MVILPRFVGRQMLARCVSSCWYSLHSFSSQLIVSYFRLMYVMKYYTIFPMLIWLFSDDKIMHVATYRTIKNYKVSSKQSSSQSNKQTNKQTAKQASKHLSIYLSIYL